jgi:hypothetical protein
MTDAFKTLCQSIERHVRRPMLFLKQKTCSPQFCFVYSQILKRQDCALEKRDKAYFPTFLNIYVGTQPENVKIIIKILN